jgi:hypothetical protein
MHANQQGQQAKPGRPKPPTIQVTPESSKKKRKRDDDRPHFQDTPSRFHAKVPSTPRELHKAIQESRDKVFIIRYQAKGEPFPKWYVVQILLTDERHPQIDSSKRQIKKGTYDVWFQVRHREDSKKLSRAECKYWPEVREFDEERSWFGSVIWVHPRKVNAYVRNHDDKHGYHLPINLLDDAIVGPFDFVTRHADKQRRYVPDTAWNVLRERAAEFNVGTDDLDQVYPLKLHRVNVNDESAEVPYRD